MINAGKSHLESLKRHCRQETETAEFAKAVSAVLLRYLGVPKKDQPYHINIALEGNLGAGKTAFARYLIQALGYSGKVKSPTYSLCESYSMHYRNHPFTVFHFDLYRMRTPLEWQEAGLMDHFDEPGLCLIEWPEKAEGTLPPMDLCIAMASGETETARNINLIALSPLGFELVASIFTELP